jgi:tetratricopeptide (TPR) repeat protein
MPHIATVTDRFRRPLPRVLERWACVVVPLAALSLSGCAGGQAPPATPAAPSVSEQMRFGVAMAQRGLWREALFRFEQAELLAGEDPEVLGNVAVALEATGDFDRALTYYKRALAADPVNRELKRNYARFVEFYQSFRPAAAKAALAGGANPTAEAAPPAGPGSPPPSPPSAGAPPPAAGGGGSLAP